MEFTKCQGCQLLTSIPAAARQSLHHFEVAAVLQPFQARPPLPVGRSVPQKSFVYVVVTDWSLLVVSMPSSKAGPVVLLEVPLLLILNLESHAGVDVGDVVNDSRGDDIRTACISIYPKQRQQQHRGVPPLADARQQHNQQDAGTRVVQALQAQLQRHLGAPGMHNEQQQQQPQPPWQPDSTSHHHVLQAVSEVEEVSAHASTPGRLQAAPQQQQLAPSVRDTLVQVQHVGGSSSAVRQAQQHPQQQQQQQQQLQRMDEGYCLQLMTVERCSRLWFHLHRAWVGAHMRAALAAAGAPGLSSWVPPTAAACKQPPAAASSRQPAGADILVLSHGSDEAHSPGLQDSTPQQHGLRADGCWPLPEEDCIQTQQQQQQQQQRLPTGSSSSPFAAHTELAALRRVSDSYCCTHRAPAAGINRRASHSMTAATAAAFASSGSIMLQDAQRRMHRPSTAGALAAAHRPRSPLLLQQPVNSSASSSSRSSSRPSTADIKQLLQQQQAGPAGSGWSRWAGLARRFSLGNFPLRPPSRGSDALMGHSSPDGSPPASRGGWRPIGRGQQHELREFMQAGAEVLVQPTAAVAREVFWELADALLAPCSLFDAGDTLLLHRSMVELANSNTEQAAAMQAAFFNSSKVLEFIVARLTSWGSLMGLFPEGLPPIQNPAQPGCIEAWQGRPVVWATWLVYPGRPKALLRGLGLTGHSSICFTSALQTALSVAGKHSAAVKAWASSSTAGSGSSSGSSARQVPLGQTYYADPLNLSPLAHMPYLFVAYARRMLADSSSESGAEGPARQLAAGTSCLAPYGDASLAGDPQEGDDLVSRGTMAEVTVVLRWERLVGRLAAAAAQRKTLLLLQWLQLHLAFTEGCGSRATWLSHKALNTCQAGAGGVLSEALTFRAATQQLVAYLLTLHLPHTRACLAAAPQATTTGSAATSSRTSDATTITSSRGLAGGKAGPESMEDFLWWAEGRSSSRHGSSSAVMLDSAVGVLHELLGLAQHEDQLLSGRDWAEGAVMEVLREVPQSCLQPLLRAMFLRFVCLMTVSSDSSTGQTHAHAQHQQHGSSSGGANSGMLQPGAAAVLAYRYGSVLLELLGGVLGCAAHLHQCFSVEVQHLMAVPQVEARLAAAAASCRSAVLGQLNQQLLGRVLAAVRVAPPQWGEEQQQRKAVAIQQLRPVGGVLKVQN